ncbi:MAG: hypothetical protein H8E22_07880 [Candidatus Cloacimonetes bacterium]|nr:hypothetical protein [Candidatus Cloacimonadota bacterium]
MKNKNQDEKGSNSLVIKSFIKLFFNFLNHIVKDWENKFSNRGYKELSQKYDVIEKKVFKDIHDLRNKIEKLTVRIFWLNLLAALLLCCVVIELILLIKLG